VCAYACLVQLADAEAKLNEIKDRHKDIQQLEKSLLVRGSDDLGGVVLDG
jgi:t-SNARE complex subunit (syntaxin)